MSTYFGWQRVIWFDQLLMQYEIFWRGMHYELMHYELVYCTVNAKRHSHHGGGYGSRGKLKRPMLLS